MNGQGDQTQQGNQTQQGGQIQNPQDATGGGQQQQPGSGDGGRVFSQADLDRIVAERLTRERQKYADYEDLKTRAKKWAEYEETQKSELQKAQDRAKALEAERDRALVEANDRLIQAAFVAAAAQAGAAHPEDAFNLADLGGVVVGTDGKVAGVAEAVKALVDAGRLPLSGKPRAPGLDGGAGGGGQQPSGQPVELAEEERAIAQRLGLTVGQYQKAKKKREA